MRPCAERSSALILECTVGPGRPQMTIWHVHISCWIPRATNTHSKYAILTAFHCISMLRYTYTACLFLHNSMWTFLLTKSTHVPRMSVFVSFSFCWVCVSSSLPIVFQETITSESNYTVPLKKQPASFSKASVNI